MIIDLKKILRSGKDREDFFFEYAPEIDITSVIPNAKILAPVKITGGTTLTSNHSAIVAGEIVFSVAAPCTRCLEPSEREFVIEFDEDVDGKGDSYPIKNDVIDLKKIVDDAIVLNLPTSFLCSEDCKGLCPVCGKNLNDGDCGHQI